MFVAKKAKGRKYSAVFKQYCLSLYFSSPRAYKVLINQSFCLPSRSTLERFTRKCYIDTGLQDNIFELLKIKTDTFKDINKYCVICIDEMSLKAHLFYNISRDRVIDFENTGCLNSKNSTLPACNVAVMMVKGICESWKQPFSYFFLHSTMKTSDLVEIIKQAVRKLKAINLKVVALIIDMGSNFYKFQLFQLLNIDMEQPYFEVDGEKYIIFLIPHTIKATRNNLYQHSFVYNNKCTSWKYIEEFYESDKKAQFRAAPKLTDDHI